MSFLTLITVTRNSCQHCDNAPCVMVCPTGAAYKDEQTGIVDVHKEKCVGCGYCLLACPYQVRFFNPKDGSADKCNFCRDTNLAQGKLPACVESCPTTALIFGDLNDALPTAQTKKVQESRYKKKGSRSLSPILFFIGLLIPFSAIVNWIVGGEDFPTAGILIGLVLIVVSLRLPSQTEQ